MHKNDFVCLNSFSLAGLYNIDISGRFEKKGITYQDLRKK